MDYNTIKLYLDNIKQMLNDIACIPSVLGSSTNIANISEVSMKILFHMANINADETKKWLNKGFQERFRRFQMILKMQGTEVSNDVEFDRIQDVLIQGIRDAKYLIWVAVAWFSNEVLYQELLKKKQNGIHIRIIISDEDSNQNLLQGLKENFECVVVPRSGVWGTNRMHDKFCIVDLDYIMHGS